MSRFELGWKPRRATTRSETPTSRPLRAFASRRWLAATTSVRSAATVSAGRRGLYGNGMMFTRSLFDGRRWTGHLVEDAELQNELLLDGHLVTYVPDAVVWAEMPQTLEQATSQNQRWERGRIEMAQRYVPELLARPRVCTRATSRARVDAVLDHLVPPLSALVAMQLAAAGVHAVGAVAGHRASRVALAVDAASIAVVAGHAFAGLASVGAPADSYKALLSAPKVAAWKVALWAKAMRPDRAVDWTRTERNVETAE